MAPFEKTIENFAEGEFALAANNHIDVRRAETLVRKRRWMPSTQHNGNIGPGCFHRLRRFDRLDDHRSGDDGDADTNRVVQLFDDSLAKPGLDRGIDNIYSQSTLLGDRCQGQQRQGRGPLRWIDKTGKRAVPFYSLDFSITATGNWATRRPVSAPRIVTHLRRRPGHTRSRRHRRFNDRIIVSKSVKVR